MLLFFAELLCGRNSKVVSVFSLNFSSAGKGPFMAGKVKNMDQRCTFLERRAGGSRVRDMACLRLDI